MPVFDILFSMLTAVEVVGLLHQFVCVSVILHDVSKTDAARIIKLDVDMFQDGSWKSVYFVVRRSKVKAVSHKKHCRRGSLHACECWLFLFYYRVIIEAVVIVCIYRTLH